MGIWVKTSPTADQLHSTSPAHSSFTNQLSSLGLAEHLTISTETDNNEQFILYQLRDELCATWAADGDTTQLCQKLKLDTINKADDLESEILITMLLPHAQFKFPSHAELASSVRIRMNVVNAARKTTLDFRTTDAERPNEYWTYDEDRGFTVISGQSLITALKAATQPDESGKLYSFSCYRATEYVILLAIAQELAACNPALYQKLQQQWETKAIMSGKFHDVFLREYGSMEDPLPAKYYVPGDRLWFRNPDEKSSDITGYEGSWVFYLGCGLFTNFWKASSPYTLTSKCVEIYHWRHATWRDPNGELKLNESIVEERVHHSLQDPAELEKILQQMLKLREPKGVYVNGGCIDTTREYPRCVCPGSADMPIPSNQ